MILNLWIIELDFTSSKSIPINANGQLFEQGGIAIGRGVSPDVGLDFLLTLLALWLALWSLSRSDEGTALLTYSPNNREAICSEIL